MSLNEIEKIREEINGMDTRNNLTEIRANFAHDGCDCIHLDEQVENLIESDEPWNLEDNACGKLQVADEIEGLIREWVGKLSSAGYYPEDAERAIFDAFAGLIEENYISDTPDYDAPLPVKKMWMERFNTQLPVRLISMGIDLNG
jgi:hypothetical protein